MRTTFSTVETSTTLPGITSYHMGSPVDFCTTAIRRKPMVTTPSWLETFVMGTSQALGC